MPNQSKTFTVPQAVRAAAKRGIEARRKHGRGGLDTKQAKKEGVGSGVQRASNLMQGTVTYATVKRMLAFFNRHKAFKEHHSDPSSAAKISWDLWGGNAGYAWAKRIVKQEEKVEKGTLTAMLYFGDDYPEDEVTSDTVETTNLVTFSSLIKAQRKSRDPLYFDKDDLIEADPDEVTDVEPEDIDEAKPPANAEAPEMPPLSDKELDAYEDEDLDDTADAEDEDEVAKGVIEIDLVGDESEEPRQLPDTEPPKPVPPAFDMELALQEIEFVPEVLVSPYDHAKMKRIAKSGRKRHGVDSKAKRQGLYISRGQWNQVDLDLVQGYLSFIDDPDLRVNALAVGGEAMLDVIEKAEPKVPEKYLEGLTGEERAKRKRQIQRRMKDKHRGDPYKPLAGDKDAKTKPSKYTKTSFAAKVREEVKGSGKDEFLRAAAKVSGISRAILNEVYQRGSKAWATSGHRVGASQEAWARARVYSFCTGGKTRRTADADLWRKHKAK